MDAQWYKFIESMKLYIYTGIFYGMYGYTPIKLLKTKI